MSNVSAKKTLRLNFPQWQGGNLQEYHFGSRMLSWLAPAHHGPEETVQVPAPEIGDQLAEEDGLVARRTVVQQAEAARAAIEKHSPDRVLTLGGDCLVDLAPMAYLNKRYGGNLGVLWVDAHPDILTTEEYAHGHTYVLLALLGHGDADFVRQVDVPIKSSNVMYAGLNEWVPVEDLRMKELGLSRTGASALADNSAPILEWIARERITHVAVHLDVDVLDPSKFSPVIFNNPYAGEDYLSGVPQGRMTPGQVTRLLRDVATVAEVVGLGIAEYLPWEALLTRDMLRELPLFGE
jgi:arginase